MLCPGYSRHGRQKPERSVFENGAPGPARAARRPNPHSIAEWRIDASDFVANSATPTRSPTNLRYQEDATKCHKGQKEEMKLPFVLHFCLICHGRGLQSWQPWFDAPQRPRVQSRCQSRGQSRGQLYPLLNGVLMTCCRRLRAPQPTFATRKMRLSATKDKRKR